MAIISSSYPIITAWIADYPPQIFCSIHYYTKGDENKLKNDIDFIKIKL